mmetsp:Transcript_36667/g.105040  ORF Transcript_36667/g.105040 Transcript_36667/m.105040 type:complete len:94 (+) Transcript_36667:721-1002(+)
MLCGHHAVIDDVMYLQSARNCKHPFSPSPSTSPTHVSGHLPSSNDAEDAVRHATVMGRESGKERQAASRYDTAVHVTPFRHPFPPTLPRHPLD